LKKFSNPKSKLLKLILSKQTKQHNDEMKRKSREWVVLRRSGSTRRRECCSKFWIGLMAI